MKPEDYCREKAVPAGSSLYYACLFYSPRQQQMLQALFALQAELDDVIVECKDVSVATIKLKWWQDEFAALLENQARHPLTRRLAELKIHELIQQAEIQALLNGVARQLDYRAYDSMQQLVEEKQHGTACLWPAVARLLGCDDSFTMTSLSELAAHYYSLEQVFLAELLLQKGVCPFPAENMQALGITQNDLLQPQNSLALIEVQKNAIAKLQASMQQLLADNWNSCRREVIFAVILARIELARSEKMLKQGSHTAMQAANITPLRKLWIAWRSSRQHH